MIGNTDEKQKEILKELTQKWEEEESNGKDN